MSKYLAEFCPFCIHWFLRRAESRLWVGWLFLAVRVEEIASGRDTTFSNMLPNLKTGNGRSLGEEVHFENFQPGPYRRYEGRLQRAWEISVIVSNTRGCLSYISLALSPCCIASLIVSLFSMISLCWIWPLGIFHVFIFISYYFNNFYFSCFLVLFVRPESPSWHIHRHIHPSARVYL